ACGAGPVSGAAQQLDPLAKSGSGTAQRSTAPSTRTANQRTWDNGLSVTVSAPKSFTPTDSALPRSPRAVAFDLIIKNGSATLNRPAQRSISAMVDGTAAPQIVDSTQGYTGFVGATDEVPPGQTARVTVAFALPSERAGLQLTVRPDAQAGQRVT